MEGMDELVKSANAEELYPRIEKALKADTDHLKIILQDPAPEVLFTALRNANLSEDHLMILLKRRDLPEKLLETVERLPQAAGSHRLQVALAQNVQTPATILLKILPNLHLFELDQLTRIPGGTPDQKAAAEREITRRLPMTPLGNKITLARRGTPTVLKGLLLEGLPQVVAPCLDNPRLPEGALHQFLRSSKATPETISLIARHSRWKNRPLLQQAILKCPRTPEIWFNLWLPKMRGPQVRELASSTHLNPAQKNLIRNELKRRGL